MKPDHLKGMSDDELALTLRDTEKKLFELRFQSATDRLETPGEIRAAKKDIARIKTLQRQRQLVALGNAPDAELAKQLGDLNERIDGPGKRRTKRAIVRVAAIQEHRAAAAAKTKTTGSGK